VNTSQSFDNQANRISSEIEDDLELLHLMLDDADKVPPLYQPGPYWKAATKAAINELKEFGLSDFRGSTNGAATSYGDNAFVDTRSTYNHGIRSLFSKIYRDIYPFNKLFDSQVRLTKAYFEESVQLRTRLYKNQGRVQQLLSKYSAPIDTTKGGCLSKGDFGGRLISHHYLQLLDTLDNVAQAIDVRSKKSFFEIGGGFGVNVHLLIELFPNMRKVIYLDIPPNLYVGTQYLKSFYGDSVIDYKQSRTMTQISFSTDKELEIFCISPDQIEKIKAEVDWFHNAHSFVEMPLSVVKNYCSHVERLLSKENGSISLVSYDGSDLNGTLSPMDLPKCFSRSFEDQMVPTLTPDKSTHHFISR